MEAKVTEVSDPLRHARAVITLFKVKKVFGLIENDLETVKMMSSEYFRILELDSKPEKGERKLADDLVILISEVLETHSKEIDSVVLYKIGLLEFALEKSPYNFDI